MHLFCFSCFSKHPFPPSQSAPNVYSCCIPWTVYYGISSCCICNTVTKTIGYVLWFPTHACTYTHANTNTHTHTHPHTCTHRASVWVYVCVRERERERERERCSIPVLKIRGSNNNYTDESNPNTSIRIWSNILTDNFSKLLNKLSRIHSPAYP
jgi:hypothetical protein